MRTKRRGLRTVCTVHAVQRTIEGRARQQIPNLEAARTRGFPSRDRDASRSRLRPSAGAKSWAWWYWSNLDYDERK